MILATTNKIMKTGINHYSKEFGTTPQNTQIHIKLVSEKLIFKMAKQWSPELEVTFKQIMQKPIDIFHYEGLATPYLKKSLINFATEKGIEISNVSAFIYVDKNDELQIAFYNLGSFVNQLTLKKELENLGLNL